MTDQVFLIDFGESFEISAPPEDLGTPLSYCSPELMLDSAPSIGSDLWALGCTLFEIRTGRKLLDPFDDDMDDYLYYMVLLFGVLPEPWWSTTWENRKNFYKDDPDSQGRAIKIDSIVAREPEGMREARSIQDKLEGGLSLAIPRTPKLIRREITRHEIDIFGALLGRIFQYQPSDRLTAAEVENHEWFQL